MGIPIEALWSGHRGGRGEQVFSYHRKDTGEDYHFAVDRLLAFLEADVSGNAHMLLKIALTDQMAEVVRRDNGIEPEHLARIPDDQLDRPLLLIDWEDGQHTQIDGNHRMLRLYDRGDREALAWSVPIKLWRRFLVDVPATTLEVIELMEKRSNRVRS